MTTATAPGAGTAGRPTPRNAAMVAAMCRAVDTGDAEAFGAYFAETARYRFAGAEPLQGRAAVVAATAGAAGALPWVEHTVDQVVQVGEQLFCRFTISTEAADGAPLALPCVTVIWMDGEQIVDYRVHMDITPALAGR